MDLGSVNRNFFYIHILLSIIIFSALIAIIYYAKYTSKAGLNQNIINYLYYFMVY